MVLVSVYVVCVLLQLGGHEGMRWVRHVHRCVIVQDERVITLVHVTPPY